MNTLTAHDVLKFPETRRVQLIDWLKAHDLDPDFIWSVRPTLGFLVVNEYAKDEKGNKYLTEDRTAPVMRKRIVLQRKKVPKNVFRL